MSGEVLFDIGTNTAIQIKIDKCGKLKFVFKQPCKECSHHIPHEFIFYDLIVKQLVQVKNNRVYKLNIPDDYFIDTLHQRVFQKMTKCNKPYWTPLCECSGGQTNKLLVETINTNKDIVPVPGGLPDKYWINCDSTRPLIKGQLNLIDLLPGQSGVFSYWYVVISNCKNTSNKPCDDQTLICQAVVYQVRIIVTKISENPCPYPGSLVGIISTNDGSGWLTTYRNTILGSPLSVKVQQDGIYQLGAYLEYSHVPIVCCSSLVSIELFVNKLRIIRQVLDHLNLNLITVKVETTLTHVSTSFTQALQLKTGDVVTIDDSDAFVSGMNLVQGSFNLIKYNSNC
jgi:hypothetical protein